MASLGALTKGDRRAATGSDLSDFNLDNKHGSHALKKLYDMISTNLYKGPATVHGESVGAIPISPACQNVLSAFMDEGHLKRNIGNDETDGKSTIFDIAKQSLERIGLADRGSSKNNAHDVRVFLNRIQMLPVPIQNLLFGVSIAQSKALCDPLAPRLQLTLPILSLTLPPSLSCSCAYSTTR